MIPAKILGIQNPLPVSKPLGSNHGLSTVFLPENFAHSPSELFTGESTLSQTKVETRSGVEMRNKVLQENKTEEITKKYAEKVSPNNPGKSREKFWPTVVESLSQIRPLNESTMEASMAIAPEIVFDYPGSNTSLVPVENTAKGELSRDREVPTSWSTLAELVENSIEEIDEEEIIFTPTGFQRQNRDVRNDQGGSTAISSPPEDTYSPSVTQPVTVTSPYFAPEPEEPENLDAIVNEVYRRILDRLQIERERTGRFYSGRLPW